MCNYITTDLFVTQMDLQDNARNVYQLRTLTYLAQPKTLTNTLDMCIFLKFLKECRKYLIAEFAIGI